MGAEPDGRFIVVMSNAPFAVAGVGCGRPSLVENGVLALLVGLLGPLPKTLIASPDVALLLAIGSCFLFRLLELRGVVAGHPTTRDR